MLLAFLTEKIQPNLSLFAFATLGIFFATSSSACLNQLFEQNIDIQMSRTHKRPLPTNLISQWYAIILAVFLAVLSLLILYFKVNPLTLVLTIFSIIMYSFVYTLYLKKRTTQNIVIGGLAGALPPLLGWTSISNDIHPLAIQLVIIIFIWTPSHFWALAITRKDEYAKAGLPMLPVAYGTSFTRKYILLYSILLVAVSILPWVSLQAGYVYLSAAIVLGARYLQLAIKLSYKKNQYDHDAMKLFWWSIKYLVYLFAFLIVDKSYMLL